MRTDADRAVAAYARLIEIRSIAKPEGYSFRYYLPEEINEFDASPEFEPATSRLTFPGSFALAAYADSKLVALAACGKERECMYQIGVATSSEYRRYGLAKYLVAEISRYTYEISGIPYYSTWLTNIKSLMLAETVGYRYAWTEIYSM